MQEVKGIVPINEAPPTAKRSKGESYDIVMKQVEEVFNLEVNKGMCVSTPNPASWQTYFYRHRAKKKLEGDFREFKFKKINNQSFNVWRIQR